MLVSTENCVSSAKTTAERAVNCVDQNPILHSTLKKKKKESEKISSELKSD